MGFKEEFGKEIGGGAGRGVNRLAFGITSFIVWVFSFKKGDEEESWIRKNALRTTILMMALSFFLLFMPRHLLQNPNEPVSEKVKVRTQLKNGNPPAMPFPEDFFPVEVSKRSREFSNRGNTYVRFQEEQGYPFVVSPVCLVVPPGRRIRIWSNLPPRYVINMEEEVVFYVEKEKIPWYKKPGSAPRQDGMVVHRNSWGFVRENFAFIDLKKVGLMATSLSKEEGGLVCF